jgi:hypothetical protein
MRFRARESREYERALASHLLLAFLRQPGKDNVASVLAFRYGSRGVKFDK